MGAGINGIVVQGSEAGGHRGTWYDTPGHPKQYMVGTTTLLALIASHVKHIPLLAAGGIMTGQQVVAALAAGAWLLRRFLISGPASTKFVIWCSSAPAKNIGSGHGLIPFHASESW